MKKKLQSTCRLRNSAIMCITKFSPLVLIFLIKSCHSLSNNNLIYIHVITIIHFCVGTARGNTVDTKNIHNSKLHQPLPSNVVIGQNSFPFESRGIPHYKQDKSMTDKRQNFSELQEHRDQNILPWFSKCNLVRTRSPENPGIPPKI